MAQNNTKQNNTGNDGNGFKTAAFGFDKNDVTMYIANLRKKMKAMEEEYEQKLSEAIITARNATDSNVANANKAASDVEKDYTDKLNQRDVTIMELQRKVERLEADSEAKNSVIDSLKKRLKDGSGAAPAVTESYLNEAQELLNAAFVHLDDISKSSEILRNKLVKQQSLINEKVKLTPKKAVRSINDVPLSTIDNIMSEPRTAPEEPSNIKFSSNEDDGIMASLEITPEIVQPVEIKPEPKPAPVEVKPEPAPVTAAPTPIPEEPINSISAEFDSLLADEEIHPVEPEKPGAMSENFDFDLSSLLADDSDTSDDIMVSEIDSKSEKGDDLGDDLYEMLVDGSDSNNLSNMLAEQKKENDKIEFESSITPNLDIDPSYLVNDDKGEFDSLLAVDDDEKANTINEISSSFPVSDSDKVFDFAFSDDKENGSEDDDMSTDL